MTAINEHFGFVPLTARMLKPFLTTRASWALVAICMALGMLSVRAHTLPISHLTLAADADYLHAELVLNPFELTFFAELDANRNGRLDPAEFTAREAEVTRRITQALTISVAGQPVGADVSGVTPDSESHHLTWRAHYKVDARTAAVRVDSTLNVLTSGSHLTQVTLRGDDRRQTAQLDSQLRYVAFEAIAPAAPTAVGTPRLHQTTAWIIIVGAGLPATGLCIGAALLFCRTRHPSSARHAH